MPVTHAFNRFRVCQIVAKLLSNALDTHCIVSSRRLDKIQEVMLQRLKDKVENAMISDSKLTLI